MKNKTHLIALACGVLTLCLGATAPAQTITNGNFQEDASDFSNGTYGELGTGTNPTSIPGWIGGTALNGANTGSDVFGPSTPGTGVDYGVIYQNYTSLTQDLTFAPDTVYTLTVDVAYRATSSPAFPFYIIDDGDSTTPTPAQDTSDFLLPYNGSTFTTEPVSFTTTTGGAGYIEFGNDPGGNNSGDNTADFTNVTLSHVSLEVPEPSEWALSLLGLAGLAFVLRRRNANS